MKEQNTIQQMTLEEYRRKVHECLNNWYPKIPDYVQEVVDAYYEDIEELYNENWNVEHCAGAIFSCLL
jgi:hypothetical protein